MRNPDLVPQKDGEFDTFQQNIMARMAVHHAAWDVPLPEISALQSVQEQWNAAWDAAKIKTNRTTAQVTQKQEIRAIYMEALRPFIQRYIVHNPLVTDGERETMGIKPRKKTRTRPSAPVTFPAVSITWGLGNSVRIFFGQQPGEEGASRRAMPKDAQFVEIKYSTDAEPAAPENCTEGIMASRSPYMFNRVPADSGKRVYFFARWLNTRGKPGAWSARFSFVMP